MTPRGSRHSVPNLERALVLLETLSARPGGETLSRLAEELRLPKNAVYRITTTLLNHGYLERDGGRRLRLTRKLLTVARAALGETRLAETALPLMRGLRDDLRLSVFLGTRVGTEGAFLDQAPGGTPFQLTIEPGSRFLLHCSAPGKALLAFLPAAEIEDVLGRLPLRRFNPRTLATPGALRAELAAARRRGWAVDRAEQYEGIHCVAAPVFNQAGDPAAAIWTSSTPDYLPAARFPAFGRKVKACADAISRALGHRLVPDRPERQEIMK
jgi:DNA-binding IclR family transcriptional regulator